MRDIIEAAKRRDEQEKLIARFPAADEELPSYLALVEENSRLSKIASKLLKDVEIDDE